MAPPLSVYKNSVLVSTFFNLHQNCRVKKSKSLPEQRDVLSAAGNNMNGFSPEWSSGFRIGVRNDGTNGFL